MAHHTTYTPYTGDKSKVPDTGFLFSETPTVPDEPLISTRKLTFGERLRGKIVDEIPQEKPKFAEDKPSDPSDLRSKLGTTYGQVNNDETIIAFKGKKGVSLSEDLAVQALKAPRPENPALAKAFEDLEGQYHEIVLKLPKTVKLDRKQKTFFTKLVKDLINNDARTVIYTPSK